MVEPGTADGDTSARRLKDAIRAELAALAIEDAEAIEAATAEKVAALRAVHADVAAGNPPPRALIEAARDLNAEAMLRARAKLVTVEKRLAGLQAIAGKPVPLTYGRDGRWAG
jgi:nucleotide-binding universal stress UspA family protein